MDCGLLGSFSAFLTPRRIRSVQILVLAVALNAPALCQKAVEKSAIESLYKQGVRAVQNGDLGAARAAFEKVVRLAPDAPEGHNSLGWVLLSTGKIDESMGQFRTALRLNPK